MSTNFAIVGVAGYVAKRHIQAVKACGCHLVAATDPHTSVGILDQCSFDTEFFPEIECFDRYLEEMRRGPTEKRVDWVSVCTPNYLHDAHIRMALHNDANVLCEKPLVIDPRRLDMLQRIEQESGKRVYTILQLRVHPKLCAFKQLLSSTTKNDHEVLLTYITPRGRWYDKTWKGRTEQSGGISTNIGIHLFDLILWLFGDVVNYEVHLQESNKVAGMVQLDRARVRWFLSTDPADLRRAPVAGAKTYREMVVDGESVEFSDGFTDLHTRVYENTLAGRGFDIDDARPSIELVDKLRTAARVKDRTNRHPFLVGKR